VGHTALRSNHLDDLYRTATADEIAAMREQLRESLEAGALGLSTGLAYASAFSASTDEVMQLTEELTAFGAVYTTHCAANSNRCWRPWTRRSGLAVMRKSR
jgi:N-acyl-D-amino-acid deacylase